MLVSDFAIRHATDTVEHDFLIPRVHVSYNATQLSQHVLDITRGIASDHRTGSLVDSTAKVLVRFLPIEGTLFPAVVLRFSANLVHTDR